MTFTLGPRLTSASAFCRSCSNAVWAFIYMIIGVSFAVYATSVLPVMYDS